MNHWSFYESNGARILTRTMSESDILKQYWSLWAQRKMDSVGVKRFRTEYNEDDCISDWVMIKDAWQSEDFESNIIRGYN